MNESTDGHKSRLQIKNIITLCLTLHIHDKLLFIENQAGTTLVLLDTSKNYIEVTLRAIWLNSAYELRLTYCGPSPGFGTKNAYVIVSVLSHVNS